MRRMLHTRRMPPVRPAGPIRRARITLFPSFPDPVPFQAIPLLRQRPEQPRNSRQPRRRPRLL